MQAAINGSDESVQLQRLTWANVALQCDKYY